MKPDHLLPVPAWWKEPTRQELQARNQRLTDWLVVASVTATLGWVLAVVLFHYAVR